MTTPYRLPGIRRASAPLDAIEVMEKQLAELRRAAEQPETIEELSSRDLDRIKVHCSFCAAIESLQLTGWSRNRIAIALEVDPVTLRGWIEGGHRQRDQIPGWAIAALSRLPECAWRSFLRESQRWNSSIRAEAV
jgi:hypothetical protein